MTTLLLVLFLCCLVARPAPPRYKAAALHFLRRSARATGRPISDTNILHHAISVGLGLVRFPRLSTLNSWMLTQSSPQSVLRVAFGW